MVRTPADLKNCKGPKGERVLVLDHRRFVTPDSVLATSILVGVQDANSESSWQAYKRNPVRPSLDVPLQQGPNSSCQILDALRKGIQSLERVDVQASKLCQHAL